MAKVVRDHSDERRAYIMEKIISTPVSFPYVDFSVLRSILAIEERYNVAMNILSEEQLEVIGLDSDHVPDLLLCRWQAAKYIIETLKEKKISFVRAAEVCNLDKSYFSKYKKGERPLAIEAPALVPLCLNVLGESCNKVMFGEEGKVVLPGIYSLIARQFVSLPEDEQKELLEMSKSARSDFYAKNPAMFGTGMHRNPDELIRERLTELAYAEGKNSETFFGQNPPMYLWKASKAYFENKPRYSPRMAFIIFLAFETGYALDYFIVEDFTSLVPCYYREWDDYVKINDPITLRFIGNLMAVDRETSVKMAAPVIARALDA